MEKLFCCKLSPRISGQIERYNQTVRPYCFLATLTSELFSKFPKRPVIVLYAKRFTCYTAKQAYPNVTNQTSVSWSVKSLWDCRCDLLLLTLRLFSYKLQQKSHLFTYGIDRIIGNFLWTSKIAVKIL